MVIRELARQRHAHTGNLRPSNHRLGFPFGDEVIQNEAFSYHVPNGKYVAKLYFAETFDGITGPGQRVFSFNVQGHEFKDFDVWVKANAV